MRGSPTASAVDVGSRGERCHVDVRAAPEVADDCLEDSDLFAGRTAVDVDPADQASGHWFDQFGFEEELHGIASVTGDVGGVGRRSSGVGTLASALSIVPVRFGEDARDTPYFQIFLRQGKPLVDWFVSWPWS